MTCAFCTAPAVERCAIAMDARPTNVRAYEVRHGDTILVARTRSKPLYGAVKSIDVMGSGGWLQFLVDAERGRRYCQPLPDTRRVTVLRPGPCAKPACELHHADRGAPGAIACADHWRLGA